MVATADIDDDFRFPDACHLLDLETVIGDRLHFMTEHMPCLIQRLSPGARRQSLRRHVSLEASEHQVLRIESKQQMTQPIEQQKLAIVIFQLDVDSLL